MPGALALLTGRPSPSPEMTHTALLLVGSAWLGVCVTSCSKGILMMVGRHVVMLGFSGAEAALNLSLSILLTLRWRSPAGTAAGTLIAALLISVVGVPVFASRALGLPSRSFITASARGLAANAGAAASAILWWIAVPVFHPTWHFLIGGALCVAAALPGWWFLGMLPPERTRAAAFLLKSAPVKLIARR